MGMQILVNDGRVHGNSMALCNWRGIRTNIKSTTQGDLHEYSPPIWMTYPQEASHPNRSVAKSQIGRNAEMFTPKQALDTSMEQTLAGHRRNISRRLAGNMTINTTFWTVSCVITPPPAIPLDILLILRGCAQRFVPWCSIRHLRVQYSTVRMSFLEVLPWCRDVQTQTIARYANWEWSTVHKSIHELS